MIRALLAWLDRRIDARIEAREREAAARFKAGLAGKALRQFEVTEALSAASSRRGVQ